MDAEILEEKIDALTGVNFSLPSEVEVVMDDLASYLIKGLKIKSKKLKWKTPSLFDVIEILVEEEKLPKETLDVGFEIQYLLKQVYGDELDEDDRGELKEFVRELQKILRDKLV